MKARGKIKLFYQHFLFMRLLTRQERNDELLGPRDKTELEGQAAKYHNEDWPSSGDSLKVFFAKKQSRTSQRQ